MYELKTTTAHENPAPTLNNDAAATAGSSSPIDLERFIESLTPSDRQRLQEALDEQVHGDAAAAAARINNSGIAAQADHLGLATRDLQSILEHART